MLLSRGLSCLVFATVAFPFRLSSFLRRMRVGVLAFAFCFCPSVVVSSLLDQHAEQRRIYFRRDESTEQWQTGAPIQPRGMKDAKLIGSGPISKRSSHLLSCVFYGNARGTTKNFVFATDRPVGRPSQSKGIAIKPHER